MRHIAKVNQASAAKHNRRLTIQLLRQFGSLSRRQLAQITGLRTSTLTYIVRDLMKQGIVRSIGKAESKTVGKKQTMLEVNPAIGWAVGIGLSHGFAELIYQDASGTQIGQGKIEITYDLDPLPQRLHAEISDWAQTNGKDMKALMGIGVGVPGIVDNTHGIVQHSGWFHAIDVPLREKFNEHFDTKIVIENDVNLAVLAESRTGNAGGLTNFVYFLINAVPEEGQQVIRAFGSSLFLDGRVYRGSHYAAGEVFSLVNNEECTRTTLEVVQSLADPDAPMNDTTLGLARHIAKIIVTLVEVIDPQAVLLGGNLNIRSDAMIAEIQNQLNQKLEVLTKRKVSIRPSVLGNSGVAIGAAIATIDEVLIGDDLAQEALEQQQILREVLGDDPRVPIA